MKSELHHIIQNLMQKYKHKQASVVEHLMRKVEDDKSLRKMILEDTVRRLSQNSVRESTHAVRRSIDLSQRARQDAAADSRRLKRVMKHRLIDMPLYFGQPLNGATRREILDRCVAQRNEQIMGNFKRVLFFEAVAAKLTSDNDKVTPKKFPEKDLQKLYDKATSRAAKLAEAR